MPTLVRQNLIAGLTDELNNDPAGLGLAPMLAAEDYKAVASVLSQPTFTQKPGAVVPGEIARVLLEREKWQTIRDVIDDGSAAGKAAGALYDILQSPHVEDLRSDSGELKKIGAALLAGGVFDADDIAALQVASQVDVAGSSRGQVLGIGRIYPEFVHQIWDQDSWRLTRTHSMMTAGAITFFDHAAQVLTDLEPADAAWSWSAEIDAREDNDDDEAIILGMTLFVTVAGFAAAPDGEIELAVLPYYATGGTAFDSSVFRVPFPVDADAQYDWYTPLLVGACRYFRVGVLNSSGQTVDTNGLNAWLYRQRVTDA